MVEDDKNHTRAVKNWESLERAYVPSVVLFELAFFLVKYRLDLSLLDVVATDPKVQVVPNGLDDFMYLVRHGGEVKHYDDVGDQIVISVSKRLGVGIQTFDAEMSRLANR